MKTYELHDNPSGQPDDINQRTITVTEEKPTITEKKITIATIKRDVFSQNERIKKLILEHDALVQELMDIETALDITIDKPKKFSEHTETELSQNLRGYPDWVQPTGAHDAYDVGIIRTYPSEHGDVWISKIDANTTVPDGDWPYNRYWEPYNQ